MAHFQKIIKSFLRAIPFRFLGELCILFLVIMVLEYRIGEEKTIDWRQRFMDRRMEHAIDPRIVVIKIDDLAFRSIDGGVVSRDYLASLVHELRCYAPKAIGLDFLLSSRYSGKSDLILASLKRNDPLYLDPDSSLMMALRGSVPVVLGLDLIKNDREKIQVIYPIDLFLQENVKTGYTKVNIGRDGICRDIHLFRMVGGKELAAFAVQVCLSAGTMPGKETILQPLRFFSPDKAFASFSSKDILDGKFHQVADSWFRDKIILVGVTWSGSGDFFRTPLSGIMENGEELPGVFIHATAVKNILDNSFIPSPLSYYNYIILAISAIIILWSISRNIRVAPVSVLGLAGSLHIFLSFLLFLKEINLPCLVPLAIMVAGVCIIFFVHRARNEYEKHT